MKPTAKIYLLLVIRGFSLSIFSFATVCVRTPAPLQSLNENYSSSIAFSKWVQVDVFPLRDVNFINISSSAPHVTWPSYLQQQRWVRTNREDERFSTNTEEARTI